MEPSYGQKPVVVPVLFQEYREQYREPGPPLPPKKYYLQHLVVTLLKFNKLSNVSSVGIYELLYHR